MMSCGMREIIHYLVKHHLVDVVVTTCGGIEEDFIKCMSKFYIGKFDLDGRDLRLKGINRTGNLLVPNDDYCDFEDWMMPILDYMLEKQKKEGEIWTPSKMIHLLGERINNEESVYYWAAKVRSVVLVHHRTTFPCSALRLPMAALVTCCSSTAT